MNADWQEKWQQTLERINAYSLRERILLLLCGTAVIVGSWQFFFELPQERDRAQIQQQRTALATELTNQQAQLEALSSVANNGRPTQELDQLQSQLAQLDERLASLSQGLISADRLPEILQEVLISTTELTLQQVRTLPVRELRLSATSNGDSLSSTGVYRHSVELTVSGGYLEMLKFLQRLEALPWRFYWDQLDYAVTRYPTAEMRLRVYTLSAEEGLLGV